MTGTKKFALILSGGAARGAYEVGVLKYLFQEIPRKYGMVPKFEIICGTSVGAIHACFIAAHLKNISNGIDKLSGIWSNLKPNNIIKFDISQLFSLKKFIYGGSHGYGAVDVTPLQILLTEQGEWEDIARSLRANLLETLCVSSTSMRTGQTCVFTQTNQPMPDNVFQTNFKEVKIGIEHAMASGSIPILFPPVEVDGEWFTDGGIRQNTPIAPAVAFDATHVLSIGLWHERTDTVLSTPHEDSPSIGSLLGKIFNSFFLDNAHGDIHNLENINSVIQEGVKFAGPGFAKHMASLPKPYRYINSCSIGPSLDVGRIAADYLSNKKYKRNRLYRALLKMIDIGSFEADLSSYLLFDGDFSKLLIELGFKDAQSREKEIIKFLGINESGTSI